MAADFKEKLSEYPLANKFANFIVHSPYKALSVFVISFLILLPGILSIESMWSPRVWFDPDHQEIQKLNRFEQQFGSDTFISIGVHNPKGIFDKSTLKTIEGITEELWLIPDVTRVESLTNYNMIRAEGDDILINPFYSPDSDYNNDSLGKLKKEALNDDVLPDFFISKDATYSILYAYLKPSFDGKEPSYSRTVDEARRIKEKFEKEDLELYLIGPAAGNDAFREVSASDNKRLIPFMFFFIILMLFLQFRSFTTIALAMTLVGGTVGVTFGLLGHIGIIFNSLLAAIPGVLLAICIADSVHIFTSYFHFRKMNHSSQDATHLSLVKNFQPTFLTSLSTAISFLTITHSDIAPIRDLGLLSGFGTMMAWFYTYLILGPVLSLLSPLLDKYPPKSFEFNKLFKGEKKRSSSILMAKMIHQFRWPIIISFILLSISSVMIAIQNEVNSDPMKYFHESVVIRKAYDFTGTKLDGLRGIELVVDSGSAEGIKDPKFLRDLDAYMNWMTKEPEISGVRSVREIIKKMHQTLKEGRSEEYRIPDSKAQVGQLLFLYTMGLPQGMDLNNQFTLDNRRLRIKISWDIETSKESEEKTQYILDKAKDFNINVETGGNAPIYLSINQKVVSTFFSSMAMALGFVSFLLLIVYRDPFISLLAMLPNVIPILFGGALMQLLGKPIDIGTSIVSTVCLGIAVDDTIHFVSSYKQYRSHGMSPIDAITETFLVTGKALVVTTSLLVVGFGAFIFADFVPNRNFGMLCSMILALALLTDLLFLPALLLTIDKEKEEETLSSGLEERT